MKDPKLESFSKPYAHFCTECRHYVPAPVGLPVRWQCTEPQRGGVRPAGWPEQSWCPLWEVKP